MTKYYEMERWKGGLEVRTFETEVPTYEGRLALAFMEKLALVACDSDGEDTAGRQKLRLLKPAEVAQRGCELAAESMKELRARGWTLQLPDSKAPKLEDP